ncbi:MAG: L-aspartate oxidase [Chthonomonas sp.]|nr:L-aspartate oxidase [Chthonomonas sp.]
MQSVSADVVVVGSGIAGICAALASSPMRVCLLTKATLHSGASSFWAQGGLAAAVGASDSPRLHAQDTINAGAGLTEPEVAELLTEEARLAVAFLAEIGTRFDLDADGNFALAREAAHQFPRVLHANRDATGLELMRALALATERSTRITVMEHTRAVEIIVDAQGAVAGLVAGHPGGQLLLQTPRLILATGGSGQLYRYTTNPPEAAAEGLALAARAGAVLTDVEFVQFHPTALKTDADPLPLITEALRGAGAKLVDRGGRRFMSDQHPAAELAPRDFVARAVYQVLQSGDQPYLDAREAVGARFPEQFPNIFARCQLMGLDPRTEPIPIVPVAHYHMGGIAVDLEGRSTVEGLWACGEVSSTGVHGANRLASNSLLEAVVFGQRVAESVLGASGRESAIPELHAVDDQVPDAGQWLPLRESMWQNVGLVRDAAGLQSGVDQFRALYEDRSQPRAMRHRAWICWAMAESALGRRESRGAHFRSDYPQIDHQLKRHSRVIWEEEARDWRVEFRQNLIPTGQ